MNRGASGRCLFPSPDDVALFLKLLAVLSERPLLEIHAYCVMGNHYHLLVRTSESDLDRAMDHLEGLYTRRFHRRHGTQGVLLRGRYRAIAVLPHRHLVNVSRYIHRNPVEAGLAARPEDWPHSSFRAYLNPAGAPSWLRTAAILGRFGSIGARENYRRFVDGGIDLGTVPLSTIARAVSEEFGVPETGLKPSARGQKRTLALARGALVHSARRLGHRLREISGWIGYKSYEGATRAAIRFQEAAQSDSALARRLDSVMERLEKLAGRGLPW